MSDLSPNLSLPYLAPAQAQKHVTHNEALGLLDAVVQLAVQSRSQTEPPTDQVRQQYRQRSQPGVSRGQSSVTATR